MLQNIGPHGRQGLIKIFNTTWNEKAVPQDQKIGIITINEKGDTKECGNDGGITLQVCDGSKIRRKAVTTIT